MVQSGSISSFLAIALTLVVIGYLLGSVSPSYMLVRRRLGRDIRQLGDGNAGAENVSRLVGLRPAIAVAAFDISKGLAVVLVARGITPATQADSPWETQISWEGLRCGLMVAAGAAAIIGHSWSVYLKGAGGRGAATAVGALFGMITLPALLVMFPAFALMWHFRSTTWGLASFFVGTVSLAVFLGYFSLLGYSLTWVPYVVTLPALVGVIHVFSLKRSLARAAAFTED